MVGTAVTPLRVTSNRILALHICSDCCHGKVSGKAPQEASMLGALVHTVLRVILTHDGHELISSSSTRCICSSFAGSGCGPLA